MKFFNAVYTNYVKPSTQALNIATMDGFDVSEMLRERVRFIDSAVGYNLSDVFHAEELEAILDHHAFSVIKAQYLAGNLFDDILNALDC